AAARSVCRFATAGPLEPCRRSGCPPPPPPGGAEPPQYARRSFMEPLKTSWSTSAGIPGTLPLSLYCQNVHPPQPAGTHGEETNQFATQSVSPEKLSPSPFQNPGAV